MCHQTALSCCACCMLCRARSVTTSPSQPCPVTTPKAMLRHKTTNPVVTEKKFVTTDFSSTLKYRCCDTKVPAAQNHVATLKTLLQRRVSHLCHDKEFSVAVGLLRQASACRSSVVHAGALVMHAKPLLLRHCCSVATQSRNWAVAHPS